MTSDQLAMTRPTRRVNMRGMNDRQKALLMHARLYGEISIPWTRRQGYASPGAALIRLYRRGLLRRTKPGVYAPVKFGERRA